MRVIAVRDANETEINIYGYGEYVGNEPCPHMGGVPNPKIVLDNGDVVWGYECWWGAAKKMEEKFGFKTGDREINTVKVEREAAE